MVSGEIAETMVRRIKKVGGYLGSIPKSSIQNAFWRGQV